MVLRQGCLLAQRHLEEVYIVKVVGSVCAVLWGMERAGDDCGATPSRCAVTWSKQMECACYEGLDTYDRPHLRHSTLVMLGIVLVAEIWTGLSAAWSMK